MEKADNSNFFLRNNVLYKTCPSCTKGIGKEVFYPCPQFFGFRFEGKYIQSCCKKCRGMKGNPSIPFDNYTYKNENDILIPEIRILPLGKNEFKDYDDCIQFLTNEMPPRNNTFYYRTHNMNTEPGSMILFQYDGQIIGYSFYESENILNSEKDDYFIKQGYSGYYKFFKDSTQILSNPILNQEMFDNFAVKLGQGTTNISINYLPKLMELFNTKSECEENKQNIQNIDKKNISVVTNFQIIGRHENIKIKTTTNEKDYIKAYKNQLSIGASGEELVYRFEAENLNKSGCVELSSKVKIVSKDATLGYDILSFDINGKEKHIEVKSKSSKLSYMDFYISDNEITKLKNSDNHYIYYVSNVKSNNPELFILDKEKIKDKFLKPVLYHISLDYIIN